MKHDLDLSVVIPLFNEEESLPELSSWIDKVMTDNGFSYEILFIDDGSRDQSLEVIKGLASKNPAIKCISFRRNYGKSAALNVGFEAARGEVVITMDADLQDSPDEIPELRKMIVQDGYDLVSGWKKKRYDPLSKTIPTKLFNAATRSMSGIQLHDFNCGLKAYKHEVIKSIEIFGEMHRYIPVLAGMAGFRKIGEKVVEHRARKYGSTKFGLDRFINGFLDLFTIAFLAKFGKRPMHFFGPMGTLLFAIGFIIAGELAVEKLFFAQYKMTERPVFYLAILCMILGTQFALPIFLGELILRNSGERNNYQIKEKF